MTDTRPATWDGPPGQPCECPNLAGDCDGTHAADLPDAAITAAADAIASRFALTSKAYPREMARVALEAAAPALRAAERARLESRITALENALHAHDPYHDLLKDDTDD